MAFICSACKAPWYPGGPACRFCGGARSEPDPAHLFALPHPNASPPRPRRRRRWRPTLRDERGHPTLALWVAFFCGIAFCVFCNGACCLYGFVVMLFEDAARAEEQRERERRRNRLRQFGQ